MPILLGSIPNTRIQHWRRITLFILLAIVSIVGWLRMAEAIKVYDYLIQLGLNPHPLYFIISGGLIGILFLIAIIARLIKTAWSTKFIRLCSIVLGIQLLIENAVLSINQPGVLSITIEFMVIIAIYLLSEKSSEGLEIK